MSSKSRPRTVTKNISAASVGPVTGSFSRQAPVALAESKASAQAHKTAAANTPVQILSQEIKALESKTFVAVKADAAVALKPDPLDLKAPAVATLVPETEIKKKYSNVPEKQRPTSIFQVKAAQGNTQQYILNKQEKGA